jgi:hypothetical protein
MTDKLLVETKRLIFAIRQIVEHWDRDDLSILVNEARETANDVEYWLATGKDIISARTGRAEVILDAVKAEVELLIAWAEADDNHHAAQLLRQARQLLEISDRPEIGW